MTLVRLVKEPASKRVPEQQDAVLKLYRLLEQMDYPPSKGEVHLAWRKLDESTHLPIQRLILKELHTMLANWRSTESRTWKRSSIAGETRWMTKKFMACSGI